VSTFIIKLTSKMPRLGLRTRANARFHPLSALAAPTRVSPAPATEQEQHHKNNQYGFHVAPHL
jgi:hypothetical protein